MRQSKPGFQSTLARSRDVFQDLYRCFIQKNGLACQTFSSKHYDLLKENELLKQQLTSQREACVAERQAFVQKSKEFEESIQEYVKLSNQHSNLHSDLHKLSQENEVLSKQLKEKEEAYDLLETKYNELVEKHEKVIRDFEDKLRQFTKENILERLITINGHGVKTNTKIIVPEHIYIMIPHEHGTEQPYTTPDANKNILFEEQLYAKGHFNYIGGWKLYQPGDKIDDMIFLPFTGDGINTCEDVLANHKLQGKLAKICKNDNTFTPYCPLYCTKKVGDSFELIKFKNKNKLKIKTCGRFNLSDLLNNLLTSLKKIPHDLKSNISPNIDTIDKTNPILIIPFTCNSSSGKNFVNNFDESNEKLLWEYFSELEVARKAAETEAKEQMPTGHWIF